MADKKSGTKLVIGLAVVAVLRLVYTIVKQLVTVLAKVIVYFGLYVPFFYGLFGVIMVAVGAFSFDVVTVDTILFYVGLGLCFGVSIGLFVRSYGKKPISSVAEGSMTAIREARPNRPKKRKRVVTQDTRPLFVYYSEVEPTLLIHEYTDHFDVFFDDRVNPIRFLRRENKPEPQGA